MEIFYDCFNCYLKWFKEGWKEKILNLICLFYLRCLNKFFVYYEFIVLFSGVLEILYVIGF